MKTLLAALVALSTVVSVANAGQIPSFDGPAFGPADVHGTDGPAFGPADVRGTDGPAFGPADVKSSDGPARAWDESSNQR